MSRTKLVPVVAVLGALVAVSLAQVQSGNAATAIPATQGAAAPRTQAVTALAKAPEYGARHSAAAKLDLNGASREELMKLSGISGATADKIIAARPLASKRALLSKKLVSHKEYEAIAMQVMVKQEPLAANKTHR